MDEKSKVLVLGFQDDKGNNVSITINKPVIGLTGSEVSSAMDGMIASQSYGKEGFIKTKVSAKYVTQNEQGVTL